MEVYHIRGIGVEAGLVDRVTMVGGIDKVSDGRSWTCRQPWVDLVKS